MEQNNNTGQIRPEDGNILNGGRVGERNPNMSRGVGVARQKERSRYLGRRMHEKPKAFLG